MWTDRWAPDRRAARLALALALLATAVAAPAAEAAPADVTFEAETMSLPAANGGNGNDATASGGAAKLIWSNGAATKDVTTTRSSIHLFVRARGDACEGDARISVKIGAKEWYAGPVSSAGWAWIGTRISIPAGTHTVSIAFTNDHSASTLLGSCDRNAWIDQVTVVATPFRADGWRNAPLADDAPIKSNSAVLRDELKDQVQDSLDKPSSPENAGTWVNTSSYAAPVYVVPPGQPTVRVDDPQDRTALQAQWDNVPLPADAQPASGTDSELTVYQPSTNTIWDFWQLRKDLLGNWAASYGGRMTNAHLHEGHFEDPPIGPGRGYGATATSIAFLAGLQRIEEIRRGVIDHAVDFGVTAPRGRDGWCWPAQRTDRKLTSRAPEAIPAGTRFRLPASLNIDALPITPYAKILAKAVQKYGMVARDSAGLVTFYAENWGPTGSDPYGSLFGGPPNARPGGALANFPWDQLQVIEQPSGADRGCQDDPDVEVP
ncbi:MAG TPA: carbohydrate-binding domain-containing protein [Thermoleophilaceae bacterium]